jgi:hypothetical protein
VTFLQTVPCRDHRHPLVMIQLKEPPAGNEPASAFAALARRNMPMTPPGIGMVPGMGMAPGIAPGTQGRPSEMVMRQATGGGGPCGGPGGLQCIVWHEVCGWTTLYISRLGINIPFYYCWPVCDTMGASLDQITSVLQKALQLLVAG